MSSESSEKPFASPVEKLPETERKDEKTEEDPRKFLEFEKLTQPNEEIKKLAEGLRGKTGQQTLENALSFLGENLKHVDLERENPKEWKKLFNNRAVEEILESKTSYGCGDTAAALTTLMRVCEIPVKFIEGKRIGKTGAHSWAEAFIEGKWVGVDPTQGIKGMEFDPEKSKHGPYVKISESLGPSDSIITSYKDWKKVEKAWDYKTNTFKKGKEPQLIEKEKEPYLDFEKIRSTHRGLDEVCRALGLQKEQFRNKSVLDIGSGLGGLALDLANLPELKTKIISLDPRYTKESFQKSFTDFQEKYRKNGGNPPETIEALDELKRKFHVTEPVTLLDAAHELQKKRQPMVAGSAEALPFKDKSFDMVVSSYAIPVVMEESPERIQKAIQEIGRVLKTNGAAYLGPLSNELRDFVEALPPTSGIRREFHGSKETEEEAARYGIDAGWVLTLQKLRKLRK